MTTIRTLPPDLPERFVPAGTKGRILSASLVSFAAHGFYGTSIRTIADSTGINSATLYSHFPSKEHILAELVSIGSRELMDRITAELDGADSAGQRLDAIITATVVGHAEHPLLAIVTNLEFSALSAELGATAMAPTAEAAALLRSILADGAADGSFDFSDLEITAHVLEGMAQQIPLWLDPRVDEPQRLAREFVQIARRMTAAS
ncbi:TetR/AcrR family transcriptional regulator [soil metagenome]